MASAAEAIDREEGLAFLPRFSADGLVTWPVDVDYLEPVVALSAMTSATSKAELGTSVLILPMRNPILFAKQAACIDAISHGRLVLGVGVGWLREEFEALDADFDARGAAAGRALSNRSRVASTGWPRPSTAAPRPPVGSRC